MASEHEQHLKRLSVFLRDVLTPLPIAKAWPIEVAAAQVVDSNSPLPSPQEAQTLTYHPVKPGWLWGPKWSTCWFRIIADLPVDASPCPPERSAALRFSSGTEAIAWERKAGGRWTPSQGLDVNRDLMALRYHGPTDRRIDLLVEAACNHPFGVTGFEWDDTEVHRRWKSETPGILERCEWVWIDSAAERLRCTFSFALDLFKHLPEGGARAANVLKGLESVVQTVSDSQHSDSLAKAADLLKFCLDSAPAESATTCFAVGHAHIDTAWLWPIRETKRKCLRTWTNQLNLLDDGIGATFLCSQAQQYAWIEESCPPIFERIRAAVAAGQWEPEGGMWVEPDCNVPSGESLVRQILHGVRYWTKTFGDHGKQTILFLPDTFGFPASLPQIMQLAGLDTFITNKLWWNQTNEFPHTSWVWRGIDGTDVLAHNTPGRDYNATNTPRELIRGEASHRSKDVLPPDTIATPHDPLPWLQPFGFGDGGGGPTGWMFVNAQLAARCDGLPRVSLSGARPFRAALHTLFESRTTADLPVPTWVGELYLELHRGTLTSQAWIKAANRRAEEDLRLAELLTFGGPAASTAETTTAADKLDKAWKLLLTNQFHDILPGSSIGWVYEDSRRDFARIGKVTEKLIDTGTTRWLAGLSTEGFAKPLGVFNPCSGPQSGVVEVPSADPTAEPDLCFVNDVPALGVKVIDRTKPPPVVPARASDDGVLSNGILRVQIDTQGRIASLGREGSTRDWASESPLNQLVLYADRPHMWDAWDIDAAYERTARPVDADAESIEVVADGPLRAAIRVARPIGAKSRIVQIYTLDAGSPRIDIHTEVTWHERHTLLRALFPTAIRSDIATYDIQFGTVSRPTHRNTSWDAAKFEVAAHRWMDLSRPGMGLALINDSKYGHSCHDATMGLSLLRSPTHPDPEADQGSHEFSYALFPHDGDWRTAAVDRAAEAFNMPLTAYALNPNEPGPLGTSWAPFRLSTLGPGAVFVDAVKDAADASDLVVRLHEGRGGDAEVTIDWAFPVIAVHHTDLLEETTELQSLAHADGRTTFTLTPYQIVTLKVQRSR